MGQRMKDLVGDAFTVKPFSELSLSDQLAVIMFMAVDGGAWVGVDLSPLRWNAPKSELMELVPAFVELYGDTLFGTACLSASKLQDAVMSDPEIAEAYTSWAEYHAAYLNGDVPSYSETDRWPVILSEYDDETIRDGWHRFHSYIRDGAAVIPVVFFPSADQRTLGAAA